MPPTPLRKKALIRPYLEDDDGGPKTLNYIVRHDTDAGKFSHTM